MRRSGPSLFALMPAYPHELSSLAFSPALSLPHGKAEIKQANTLGKETVSEVPGDAEITVRFTADVDAAVIIKVCVCVCVWALGFAIMSTFCR